MTDVQQAVPVAQEDIDLVFRLSKLTKADGISAAHQVVARHRLASLPCKSGEGAGQCPASPDHADIKETIEDAADDWQANGYTSALSEVRDMAAVGRSLMEALPKGYCYMDSPAEIVSDLQNDLDEARGIFPNLTGDVTQTREAELVAALEPFVKHWQPWMDATEANDNGEYNWPDTNEMSCFARVTYGDLRHARAALNARGGA